MKPLFDFRRIAKSALLIIIIASSANAGTIRGTVLDEHGRPLAGGNIHLLDTRMGAATDLEGRFLIPSIDAGTYTLQVSMVGYSPERREVTVSSTGEVVLDFTLKVDAVALEELIFTAERNASGVTLDEPVRTEVVVAEELQKESSDGGLLSALRGTTGLNTRPCALCGSAGIGMQGLDPSYTEVNVDGLPLLSGIGALYGLDAVSVSDLSRVELRKGGGNVQAGSGAMAGSVNLVTARPKKHRSATINLSGAGTMRHFASGTINSPIAGIPSRLSVTYASEPRKLDRNNDGITDAPQYTRSNASLVLGNRLGNGDLRIGTRVMREERFAGETGWTDSDRGSAEIYGRDIHTNRAEASVSWREKKSALGGIWIEAATVYHHQDSWYGTTHFDARQRIITGRAGIKHSWNVQHSSEAQIVYRHEQYDDNLTLSTETDRLDNIPGALIAHTWIFNDKWTTSSGLRGEFYADDGVILTPRASLRYAPDFRWTFLLSGGSGYRPVTIFSLDKAVHAGFDNVVVPKTLEPERSFNSTLSVEYRRVGISRSMQLTLTGFYTVFDNKVILAFGDHGTAGTVYTNAPEAFSRGVELRGVLAHDSGWTLRTGASFNDVRFRDATGWHLTQMQNRYTADATVEKAWKSQAVTVDFGANIYGPMSLPQGRSRSDSPAYATLNAGLRKDFGSLVLSASVENITDYVQPDNPLAVDPLTGESRFDSAMIYGPLLGRVFLVGLRYNVNNPS